MHPYAGNSKETPPQSSQDRALALPVPGNPAMSRHQLTNAEHHAVSSAERPTPVAFKYATTFTVRPRAEIPLIPYSRRANSIQGYGEKSVGKNRLAEPLAAGMPSDVRRKDSNPKEMISRLTRIRMNSDRLKRRLQCFIERIATTRSYERVQLMVTDKWRCELRSCRLPLIIGPTLNSRRLQTFANRPFRIVARKGEEIPFPGFSDSNESLKERQWKSANPIELTLLAIQFAP